MLKIILGQVESAIYSPRAYFDTVYEPEWITTDFARKVIADVDKSTVISENIIDSPILGPIPPRMISGGTKTILLMEILDSELYNISGCGNNCAKWILDIGSRKDITVNLRHVMNFGDEPFEFEVLNNGIIVRSMMDFLTKCHMYV